MSKVAESRKVPVRSRLMTDAPFLLSSYSLHVDEGFVPLVHWSAESDKENSHLNAVECVQGWAKKWTPGCENYF